MTTAALRSNVTVAVYGSHTAAVNAVDRLRKAGYDMTKLSIIGGLSAIGAGLYGMGIPKNSVVAYEAALKAGKFVLVAHGSQPEATQARELLAAGDAEVADQHAA